MLQLQTVKTPYQVACKGHTNKINPADKLLEIKPDNSLKNIQPKILYFREVKRNLILIQLLKNISYVNTKLI